MARRSVSATSPPGDGRPFRRLITVANLEPSAADFQLALDALRDGVILWSAEGRVLVANAAAARLFGLPEGLIVPGARRVDLMTFLARRGDYGATEDPERLAAELSDRFATGAVTSLTRRLPDGRHLRADARPAEGGRLVVTYREVQPSEGSAAAVAAVSPRSDS
jgi:PAS domain-containing protein